MNALLTAPAVELRTGAVQGLGQLRTRTAVKSIIDAAGDPALRLAAIRALGASGSPFVLRREANPDQDAIQAAASHALIQMLAAPDAAAHADALVETIVQIHHPTTRAELAGVKDRIDPKLAARIEQRLSWR